MSHISTDLSMNGFKLFTEPEIIMCTVFNIKVFVLFILILIALSCISSCMQAVFGDDDTYKCGCKTEICKCKGLCESGCGCKCNAFEQFGNDHFFSYKDTVYPNYTSYQSAPLSSLDESLNFGQAKRYIMANDDGSKPLSYILDIYCNLYLLNAAPFGMNSLVNPNIKQAYLVYLRKDDNKKFIGQLTTDSSQIYKLKFKSDKPEDYLKFNHVDIIYKSSDLKETTVMSGRFTIG